LADDPITLEELAAEFGVSRERVRQIEMRAFEKLQRAVKARVAAMETPDQVPAARGDRRRRIGEACASDTYNLAEFAVPGLPPK
jgi:acetyl-CoA acetyltransferase